MNTERLKPLVVYRISYATRPPCEEEAGSMVGFWTGEIDTWGKRTIIPLNGSCAVYLFCDEIKDIQRVRA